MQLKEFKKKMKKSIFTKAEAQVVALDTVPNTLKLQLHNWVKSNDLVAIKRGLYAFSDKRIDKVEVALNLYSPSYVSLESALNIYGLIPDVPFSMTLVTPKTTRKFNTLFGQFVYRKLKKEAFFGFDPKTLIAEREKALVDYLYLNGGRLLPRSDFWEEMRFQNLSEVDFDRALDYAKKFDSSKLIKLVRSVKEYANFG